MKRSEFFRTLHQVALSAHVNDTIAQLNVALRAAGVAATNSAARVAFANAIRAMNDSLSTVPMIIVLEQAWEAFETRLEPEVERGHVTGLLP